MAVPQDPVNERIWRFWIVIVLYSILWVAALLLGLGVLPYVRMAMAWLGMPGMSFGQAIESWLYTWRHADIDTERYLSRTFSLGFLYLLPPMFAIVGTLLVWALWLSILSYIGLMIRVRWHYAKRPAS